VTLSQRLQDTVENTGTALPILVAVPGIEVAMPGIMLAIPLDGLILLAISPPERRQ